jgi:hypothetical protein
LNPSFQQAPRQLWWHQIAQSSQIVFLKPVASGYIPYTYDTNVANGWLFAWLCELLFYRVKYDFDLYKGLICHGKMIQMQGKHFQIARFL